MTKLWFLLLLGMCYHSVDAFPYAAGACPGGEAAVGSPHKGEKEVVTGSLIDGGYIVTINDIPLSGKPASIRTDELNNVTLTATGGTEFKGFLIRIGPPPGTPNVVDLRDSAFPRSSSDTATQVATQTCVDVENVGGLTHASADLKTEVAGTLLLEEVIEELSLDVTVVVENTGSSSIYYYSNFRLNAVNAVPINAPIAAPPTTSFPSMAPSMSPSNGTMTENAEGTGGIDVDEGQDEQEDPNGGTGGNSSGSAASLVSVASMIMAIVAGTLGLVV